MNDGVNVPMTPANQDASVQRLIDQRTDYDYNKPFDDQVESLSGQWASFPNEEGVSNYNQPAHHRDELIDIYNGRYETRLDEEKRRVYGMR